MQIENIATFPQEINAGVTLRNLTEFPPFGFSISKTELIDEKQIEENRKSLSDYLGVDYSKMKFQKQVHSDFIRIIDENSETLESDGMITNVQGLVLNVSIADCAAILIYDKFNKVIAGIHSGWRGTKLNIAGKAIALMQENFGTQPSNLICYISACASGKNYEVGEEVAQFFPNSITKLNSGKYLFDNKNEIKNQLIQSGISENSLHISEICTIENENYHSFRRDKDKSGRMSAFISLK